MGLYGYLARHCEELKKKVSYTRMRIYNRYIGMYTYSTSWTRDKWVNEAQQLETYLRFGTFKLAMR